MSALTVRPAQYADAMLVSGKLRPEDQAALTILDNHTPLEALLVGIDASERCYSIILHHRPIAVFGIIGLNDHCASLWMLGTGELKMAKTACMRLTKRYIAEFLTLYNVLFNWVDNRDTVTINWLARCGARINDPAPRGKHNSLFRYFEFRRGGGKI